jgi:hypothetical protein
MLSWLRRHGVLTGAALAVALFVLSFLLARPSSLAGVDLETVRQIAERDFSRHIALFTAKLVAFTALFGAIAGLWAGWVAGRSRILYLGAYFVFIGSLAARAMAKYPQLFADRVYLQGGAWETLQVFVTSLPNPWFALVPIAVLTLSGLRNRPPQLPSRLAYAFVLPLLIAAQPPVPRSTKPNILILAADSLRPDYITPIRTPNIQAMLRRSTAWTNTFVHIPRTFPSWSEILSGDFETRTGIRTMFPSPEERRFEHLSLLKHFHAAGYRSFVVSDYAGDIFPRFSTGISETTAPIFTFRSLIEENIIRTQPWLYGALTWRPVTRLFPVLREFSDLADPEWLTQDLIEKFPEDKSYQPFIGFAFYSVTHFPYAVPFPDYRTENFGYYRGPYKDGKPPLVGEKEITNEGVQQTRALYGGGVHAFDREVGEIWKTLQLQGLIDNTIIVIIADHGENLYERAGDTGHGDHLIGNESLSIPFIVFDPTGTLALGERTGLVQSVDILPTLMDVAGIPVPPNLDGRSMADPTAPTRPAVFAESGMWFADTNQEILKGRRIPYPDILHIGTVDDTHGDQIVLQNQIRPLVYTAKHHMAFDGNVKVIYEPTPAGARWEAVNHAADPTEMQPYPVPAPGKWYAQSGVTETTRVHDLQRALFAHAVSEGSTISSGGWLIPGDGTWAP